MKKRSFASILCTAALCANMLLSSSVSASADETEEVTFTFGESGITASAEGYEKFIDGSELTIKSSGSYKVTGKCSDGSIKVKKSTENVTLTLEDLDLTSSTTAPLACNKNSQVDIIVKGEVTLTDSVKNSEDYWTDQGYTDSDSEVDAAENAVVKLKGASKVTISGDGTLNINANAKNGIKSGATLDSDLETEVEYDPESEYFAYLTMNGVTVNIDATNVYTPQSSSDSDTGYNPSRPGGQGQFGPGGQEDTDYYGDAINGESCVNIQSGTYNINADDDGIHCDYVLNIGALGADNSALDININKSYEGIEGAVVNFYSGDIDITAGDDAVNAANSDLSGSSQTDPFGGGQSSYNFELNIYGGDIYADASGGNDNDALDSNGSINVYGGRTIAISDQSGNAFDLEKSFNVTGGTLLGLGSAPMEGEKLSSSAKQTWAVWSGSSGMGGRGGRQGSSSTNIPQADQSKVTLLAGSRSYNIGSSVSGITSGTKVAVMLGGSEEIVSTTAKTNTSYITFAGDINGTPDSTLTYSANNGSDDTAKESIETGSALTVAANSFSNENGTFKEWNTSADGSGISYNAGDSFIIPCDCTLYAVWESTAQESTDTQADSETEKGFKGTFVIEGGKAAITTYDTQDYTKGNEDQTEAYARDSATGEISSDTSGQINFRVTPEDGYKVASVTATEGTYKNIKTPDDTGAENVYRITKISNDLTITVTLEKAEESSDTVSTDTETSDTASDTAGSDNDDTDSETEKGFKGTFVIEGGKAAITTYDTQDYTKGNEDQTEAYARDSATGEISTDTSGQINFRVTPEDGYKVASVTATEGTYKNIKTPDDTGAENVYRITKISGDLTITVTLEKAEESSDTESTDSESSDTAGDTPSTDSDRPTPPDMSDSDRPTPPDWNDSDRPTPPDWDDSDRPTPPDWDDSDRPTPPDMSDTDVPTPPDQTDTDTPTPKVTGNLGDVDFDGSITANDALIILRASVDIDKLTPEQLILADVDFDGVITANDALAVLRYSVGYENDSINQPVTM